MSDRYILVNKKPVKCDDLLTWTKWFENTNRRVKETVIGNVYVSTVFLGLDHSFGESKPLLFETMVFGGDLDSEQERYSTWKQAEKGHQQMIKKVKRKLKIK